MAGTTGASGAGYILCIFDRYSKNKRTLLEEPLLFTISEYIYIFMTRPDMPQYGSHMKTEIRSSSEI